jgi:hypothetical protein
MDSDESTGIIGLKVLIKLKYNKNWPKWYNFLRYHSSILKIWNRFNPNSNDATTTPEPMIPNFVKEFTKVLDRYKDEVKRWNAKPPTSFNNHASSYIFAKTNPSFGTGEQDTWAQKH